MKSVYFILLFTLSVNTLQANRHRCTAAIHFTSLCHELNEHRTFFDPETTLDSLFHLSKKLGADTSISAFIAILQENDDFIAFRSLIPQINALLERVKARFNLERFHNLDTTLTKSLILLNFQELQDAIQNSNYDLVIEELLPFFLFILITPEATRPLVHRTEQSLSHAMYLLGEAYKRSGDSPKTQIVYSMMLGARLRSNKHLGAMQRTLVEMERSEN